MSLSIYITGADKVLRERRAKSSIVLKVLDKTSNNGLLNQYDAGWIVALG
jgi:hypothetical protein